MPTKKQDRFQAYLRWKDRVEPVFESEGAAAEVEGDRDDRSNGEDGKDDVLGASNDDKVADALLTLYHTE